MSDYKQENVISLNNSVITFGDNGFTSFEATTGKINWEHKPSNNFSSSDRPRNIVHNGNNIFFLFDGRLMGLNIFTGKLEVQSEIIYDNDSESALTFFDGTFFFTVSDLYNKPCIIGIGANDGVVKLRMENPKSKEISSYETGFFNCPLLIDHTTRKMYVRDGFSAMCYRIPPEF